MDGLLYLFTNVTSSLCVFVFLRLSLVRQVDCAYELFVVLVAQTTRLLCAFVLLHLSLVRQVDCAYELLVVLATQMTRLLCAFMLCTCRWYDKLIVHMDWLLYLSFM